MLVPYIRGKVPPKADAVLAAAVDDWPAGHQVNMWLETMEQLDTRR